uniref:RuBisCO-associated protein n=2 Tax=Cajanus cajan TaxID=3821 RepID=A0A151SUZ2_CAJCA|nr:RuBisCO-associated protein [Cajanus cajan]
MLSIFRQYTYDDSFEQVFVSGKILKQYQIALTFATDYDEKDAPTNGVFRPTWDQTKVSLDSIMHFKQQHKDVEVKVFISIGNRGPIYPFKPLDTKTWASNATASLTPIIQSLQVDGIDVLYEHIDASPGDFIKCVGQLIRNLKEQRLVTLASISPSSALDHEFYSTLYNDVSLYVDWVDYQFQNEVGPVYDPTTLVQRYNHLAKDVYPRKKLFAGYSAENEDWATLSPIVFFLAGIDILKKKRAPGISIHYHNYYSQPPST